MDNFWSSLRQAFGHLGTIRVMDIVDILLVAAFFYFLITLVRRTKTNKLFQGIVYILLALWLSGEMQLYTVNYILRNAVQVGLLALVVLFQPEITVHADEKLLSQVLINLLKNAMQALEGQADGKIRMEVDTEKNQLLIRVTDNGPGVPSDLIEDIFVPFFTTKATGSGIGLSLSRQIIRMHGGELSVASLPYRETCFTVSLPVKP